MADTDPRPELLALRAQIDGIDRDLLALLNRRATLAQHVGEVKKLEGSLAFRPEREAQVIDGLKAANPGPLKPAVRSKHRHASPTSARPAPSASWRRSAFSVRRSFGCRVRTSTRCCTPPPQVRPISVCCRSKIRPRVW
jgi:chorismate mutase-like protein